VKRGASSEAPAGHRRGGYVGPLPAAGVLVVGVAAGVGTDSGFTGTDFDAATGILLSIDGTARTP
jgi:hypothetical protein